MLDNCLGCSALDVGCAEGLISIEMARRGAREVHGIEIVAEHVDVGMDLRGNLPVTLEVADVNVWRPSRTYDIVVALALLHKLRNPTEVAIALARAALEAVVLRLPPATAPTVIDARSGNKPHLIGEVLKSEGFELMHTGLGHFDEWVGYYVRPGAWT